MQGRGVQARLGQGSPGETPGVRVRAEPVRGEQGRPVGARVGPERVRQVRRVRVGRGVLAWPKRVPRVRRALWGRLGSPGRGAWGVVLRAAVGPARPGTGERARVGLVLRGKRVLGVRPVGVRVGVVLARAGRRGEGCAR